MCRNLNGIKNWLNFRRSQDPVEEDEFINLKARVVVVDVGELSSKNNSSISGWIREICRLTRVAPDLGSVTVDLDSLSIVRSYVVQYSVHPSWGFIVIWGEVAIGNVNSDPKTNQNIQMEKYAHKRNAILGIIKFIIILGKLGPLMLNVGISM